MENNESTYNLHDSITALEAQQKAEEAVMREKLHDTYESVKPVNLLKSAYHEVIDTKDIRNSIIDTSVGLVAGYISKQLVQGRSTNPLRKIAGTAVELAVIRAARKNPEMIDKLGRMAYNILRHHPRYSKKNEDPETSELQS